MKNRQAIQRQTGVALISAVLVVAMTSIAAVAMTHRLQLSIHRTSNVLMADQRYLYTLGSEAWARGQLIRDMQNEETYDALNEDWAKELPVTVVEEGQVYAKTSDLQGRFNLNNLYRRNTIESETEVQDEIQQQLELFQRLLVLLELDPAIAQATSDWLDQDIQLLFPDGAEDNEYLGLTAPYRTANNLMVDVSELKLVKGVTPEAYEKLMPYVTVLPESTPVNVNTASDMLLRAIFQSLDESSVEVLLSERDETPFKDVKSFIDSLKKLLSGDDALKITNLEPLLSVSSHYFQLETTVRMDNVDQTLYSLLYKDQRGISVLARTQG
ncbi:MAG: type II secretion system minor pseudopilin GspK, partial [Chromatiales bacterium]